LLSLSLALRVAESKLEESGDEDLRRSLSAAGQELRLALTELRDLARGIHPAVLANDGLAAAVEALAERAPIRMILPDLPGERLPPNVEAAAYYVISEATTNAAKYSDASEVFVRVAPEGEDLVVEIADDGVGGASLEAGHGLRGLADRIQALDGDLELKSPLGSGTRIVARIPCA
jgi:signal transduction histidine kinase